MGVNSAGLTLKLTSFEHLLSSIEPSLFFIEETKMKTQGKIKTKSSHKYEIFELNRKEKCGGGISIGAVNDLNPVWISEGDDDTEILVIEIEVKEFRIRCIVAYGPQENEKSERKTIFWARLSKEIEEAHEHDLGIIFQMDGNLWAGTELIKDDPNECNNNGKLFKKFLEEHPYLCVVNSLDCCQGTITRERKLKKKTERAVLDFFVVCEKLKEFVQRMIVDEKKEYPLARYLKAGKKESDHNTLILYMKLNFFEKKQERIEMFNFKKVESQRQFFQLTENKDDLTNCFLNEKGIGKQSNDWFKTLHKYFQQSFTKIRNCKNKKKLTDLDELLKRRTELVQKLKITIDEKKEEVQISIEETETKIAELSAEENRNKVVENFAKLANGNGGTCHNGLWAINKKLFPRNSETLPFAKKDLEGKLVSSQTELKKLYLETYVTRLRHRPMKPQFEHLKTLKEELCTKRLEIAKLRRSDPWSKEHLKTVLTGLKAGKARDPHQLINEIFKPGVAGLDFQASFLLMANQIKNQIFIPKFMQYANIVTIYKGKGSKLELDNDRGIFLVNIFRSIIMKMVYNNKYPIVDQNMSDSNVGARKSKKYQKSYFCVKWSDQLSY